MSAAAPVSGKVHLWPAPPMANRILFPFGSGEDELQ